VSVWFEVVVAICAIISTLCLIELATKGWYR
jgi:hypothetical protein